LSAVTFRPIRHTHFTLWLLSGIALLGFACRLYQINTPSLRGDEAFTVMHWMREPLALSLSSFVTIDPQPPLAYASYRAFALLVGSGEGSVRLLSALVSTIGIAACGALGSRLAGQRAGLFAALCYALSPAIVWHAQDARNYALWAAISPLALLAALRALDRHRPRDWVIYVLLAVAACYLYYLELIFVATLNIWVFLVHQQKPATLKRWVLSQIALALILLPWFAQPSLLSGGGYGGTAQHTDLPLLLTQFVPTLVYGSSLSAAAQIAGAIIALILATAGACSLWNRQRAAATLLLVWVTLPMLALSAISLRLAVFVPRYVLASSAAWFILVGIGGLAMLASRRARYRFSGMVLVAAFAALMMISLFNHFLLNDYAKSPNWRALAHYLSRQASADHVIINQAADPALTFYLDSERVPSEWLYLPANPRQPVEEIRDLIEQRLDSGHPVWLVASPPDWPNRDVPQHVLAERAQLLRSIQLPGLSAAEYAPPPPSGPALAQFGEVISLVGVDISALPDPDGMLRVYLTWQALRATDARLKSFLHLLPAGDDLSPPTAQDDQLPADGAMDSTTWSPNTRFREIYALPVAHLPPGRYTLRAGWYDPQTGSRLLLTDSSDGASIGEIHLPAP